MKNMESQESCKLDKNWLKEFDVLFEQDWNKQRKIMVWTGNKGKEQFDLAILDSIHPNGWIRAYNSKGDLKVYSTDEMNEVIKECELPDDVIWGMLRSKDKETMKLVSEILKL